RVKKTTLLPVLFLSLSATLFAQTDDSDIHILTAIIDAERHHIAELQQELERSNAALVEVSKRLDALSNARTQEKAAPPPVPTESTPPRFDFYGEGVMRLDTLRQSYTDCLSCPTRTRGRFRVRLGTEKQLAPGLRAVAGFAVGDLNDPNTSYQSLGGN